MESKGRKSVKMKIKDIIFLIIAIVAVSIALRFLTRTSFGWNQWLLWRRGNFLLYCSITKKRLKKITFAVTSHHWFQPNEVRVRKRSAIDTATIAIIRKIMSLIFIFTLLHPLAPLICRLTNLKEFLSNQNWAYLQRRKFFGV